MIKFAAAYIRVSTGKQAKGELSLPDQKRAIETYCQQRGWQIVGVYVDHVSASDENKRRPQFEQMVDDGLTGRGGFQVIVVHSYSRYFRIAVQAELYRKNLKKAGVEVVSVTQNFGEDSAGDMVRQVVSLFDEFQSKEIAKHVSRTMKENARQGFLNGKPPFGYEAVVVETRGDSVKKKAEINEEEKPVVELMFSLALNGDGCEAMGVKKIAEELKSRNMRNRNGRYFSAQEINKMLHNIAYIGKLVYGRRDYRNNMVRPSEEWIIIPIPPIIDEKTFYAVQAKMRERDPMRSKIRTTHHPTLLKNVECGSCGSKMKGSNAKSGRYLYYQCTKAEKFVDGGCAHPKRIGRELLNRLVTEHLAGIVFEPTRLRVLIDEAIKAERAAQNDVPRQLDSLTRRKSEIDTQLARLYTGIRLGKISLDDPVLGDQVTGLRGERDQVEAQIVSLRPANTDYPPLTIGKVREFGVGVREALLMGDFGVRRAYLNAFLERVIVNHNNVTLQGRKDLLAKAFAQNVPPAAFGSRGGMTAVLSQADNWWGEYGKARRQGCGGDGRGIGDRRGDRQAFHRRGRERGILRSGRRARPARGGRT